MAAEVGSANVKFRGNSILVVANAFLGAGRIADWEAFVRLLSANESETDIGSTLRSCLVRSRTMPSAWMRDRIRTTEYSARLANAFRLSSTRTLYAGMKNVSVDLMGGKVRFGPTRNRRGGAFEGFERGVDRGHEDIIVPFDATDEEFGRTLREALRRSL